MTLKIRYKNESGAILVLSAICLPILLAVSAFVINIATHNVTKQELQNAADASALRGANHYFDSTQVGSPNFTNASNAAIAAAKANTVNNTILTDAEIQVSGLYWDFSDSKIYQVQSASNTRSLAIKVVLTKSNVVPFFSGLLGNNVTSIQSTAVAYINSPGKINTGVAALPLVFQDCDYDSNINHSYPNITVKFDSYDDGAFCQGVRWGHNREDTSDELYKISKGTDKQFEMEISDDVVKGKVKIIQNPLMNNTLFDTIGLKKNQKVIFPTVNKLSPGSSQKVTGFNCAVISYVNRDEKTVRFNLSEGCETEEMGGSGPNYGVYKPAKLIQ